MMVWVALAIVFILGVLVGAALADDADRRARRALLEELR